MTLVCILLSLLECVFASVTVPSAQSSQPSSNLYCDLLFCNVLKIIFLLGSDRWNSRSLRSSLALLITSVPTSSFTKCQDSFFVDLAILVKAGASRLNIYLLQSAYMMDVSSVWILIAAGTTVLFTCLVLQRCRKVRRQVLALLSCRRAILSRIMDFEGIALTIVSSAWCQCH